QNPNPKSQIPTGVPAAGSGLQPRFPSHTHAADTNLLADVRDDDHDVDGGADGDIADGGLHARLRDGGRGRLRVTAVAAGTVGRSGDERPDAAVLRLVVGSDRTRKYDGHRLHPRRDGDDAVAADAFAPGAVRRHVRRGAVWLGGDFLLVPV